MTPFFRELLSQAAFLGAMLAVVSVVFTALFTLSYRKRRHEEKLAKMTRVIQGDA